MQRPLSKLVRSGNDKQTNSVPKSCYLKRTRSASNYASKRLRNIFRAFGHPVKPRRRLRQTARSAKRGQNTHDVDDGNVTTTGHLFACVKVRGQDEDQALA